MLAAANVLHVVALAGYAFINNIWVVLACYTIDRIIFPILRGLGPTPICARRHHKPTILLPRLPWG
jgi:hypothetical protein